MSTILCIVPYPGLKNKLEKCFKKLIQEYPSLKVKLKITLANLSNKNEVLSIIQNNTHDLVLSRGETVTFLKKQTHTPVIDIGISQYDIIRTIKTIPDLNKTAIICYPAFSHKIDETLAQFNLKIKKYAVRKKIDIRKIMGSLSNTGYKNILCDSGIVKHNNIYQFNSFLLESGDETVYLALKSCFLLLDEKQKNNNYYQLLSANIKANHDYTIFFSKDNYFQVIFASDKKKSENIAQKIRKAISNKKQIIIFDNKTWHLEIKKINNYSIATLDKLGDLNKTNSKANYDHEDIASIYSICYNHHFFKLLNYYAKLTSAICIVGMPGLYSKYVANLIGEIRSQNAIFINLKNIRIFQKLLKDNDSIFFNNQQLLVISGLENLNRQEQTDFFNFVVNSKLDSRNKLIFLIEQTYGTKLQIRFPNYVPVKEIFLKPLNEMSYNTFNLLVHAIFNHFSLKTGKTFTGISDPALDRLSSFPWTQNYQEFINVLTTALETATGPILTTKDIEDTLQHFTMVKKAQPTNEISPLNESTIHKGNTLHELIVEDIKRVLAENDGNKTKTAQQLDISRATLWRYLKQ